MRPGLYHFVNEVLFLPAGPDQPDYYHPRITLNKSGQLQAELADDETRRRLYDDIYVDFFFRRHEEFWREQGLVKLPPVRYATNMLIAGEDLGMVPASVPGVMQQLGILGLHIQRMPGNSQTEFGHPADAPYLSVVTTGSHDMSTLRGWWEGRPGAHPALLRNHPGPLAAAGPLLLPSPGWCARCSTSTCTRRPCGPSSRCKTCWAWTASLRRANPHDEQINVPSNPEHFWKYRLHLPLEELNAAAGLHEPLRALVAESGRGRAY